jgi:hypothetical protein
MNVTRDQAAQALDDINKASGRIVRLKGYHHGAPFFILWGLVWLVANTVTQFQPEYARFVWPGGVAFGFVVSIILGFMQSRNIKPSAASIDMRMGQRIGMTSAVFAVFIICLVYIAQPETQREGNAMISIFFPFLYMAAGIWGGWRLFAIGFVTATAIMIGFVWVRDWFDLWMGVFGGGSLIAGGLWLRSA